jgi:hypothetical protein
VWVELNEEDGDQVVDDVRTLLGPVLSHDPPSHRCAEQRDPAALQQSLSIFLQFLLQQGHKLGDLATITDRGRGSRMGASGGHEEEEEEVEPRATISKGLMDEFGRQLGAGRAEAVAEAVTTVATMVCMLADAQEEHRGKHVGSWRQVHDIVTGQDEASLVGAWGDAVVPFLACVRGGAERERGKEADAELPAAAAAQPEQSKRPARRGGQSAAMTLTAGLREWLMGMDRGLAAGSARRYARRVVRFVKGRMPTQEEAERVLSEPLTALRFLSVFAYADLVRWRVGLFKRYMRWRLKAEGGPLAAARTPLPPFAEMAWEPWAFGDSSDEEEDDMSDDEGGGHHEDPAETDDEMETDGRRLGAVGPPLKNGQLGGLTDGLVIGAAGGGRGALGPPPPPAPLWPPPMQASGAGAALDGGREVSPAVVRPTEQVGRGWPRGDGRSAGGEAGSSRSGLLD